jgi:hypothetical protein
METASEQPEFDKLVARRFLETRIEVGLAQRNPPLHRPRLVVKKSQNRCTMRRAQSSK